MFMKTIQIIIVLLMVGIPTMEAQNRLLVVKKTDGTTQEIPVKDIVEMTVEEYLPLKVNVSENEMMDPTASAKAKSTQAKAPIITTATLTSFKMCEDVNGADIKYELTKKSSGWEISRDRWPTTNPDQEVTFYAYNAGVFYNKYVQFEVDPSPWQQTDLLVASNTTSYNANNGCVNLTFDHACAAVEFQISMTKTLSEILGGTSLKVKWVELKNVKDTGKYFFGINSWEQMGSSGNVYPLTNTDMEITTTPETMPCGYLFMIPQDFQGDSTAELVINYTVGSGGSTKTVSIPLKNFAWDTGKKHVMNIKLNTSMIEL